MKERELPATFTKYEKNLLTLVFRATYHQIRDHWNTMLHLTSKWKGGSSFPHTPIFNLQNGQTFRTCYKLTEKKSF